MFRVGNKFFRTKYPAFFRSVEFFLMSKPHSRPHKQAEPFTSLALASSKMTQNWISIHQVLLLKPDVGPVTAILILLRVSHYLCPQRVQMDVPDKLSQVSIGFTQNGFVPPLEQMTYSLVRAVIVLAVSGEQSMHYPAYGIFSALDQQMNMIWHQAVCVQVERQLCFPRAQQQQQLPVVIVRIKDPLAIIAASDEMI